MAAIKNLNRLLGSMEPKLVEGKFVFCTFPSDTPPGLSPIMTFIEGEGITLILNKKEADSNSLKYSAVWSLITLNVHSDIEAVGFLAKITEKLAKSNISVNAISAFYHDHLFIPVDRSEEAFRLLEELKNQNRN